MNTAEPALTGGFFFALLSPSLEKRDIDPGATTMFLVQKAEYK
ncbi:hypothetical protein ACCT30_20480 [Rhizobium ruizarguesonis]